MSSFFQRVGLEEPEECTPSAFLFPVVKKKKKKKGFRAWLLDRHQALLVGVGRAFFKKVIKKKIKKKSINRVDHSASSHHHASQKRHAVQKNHAAIYIFFDIFFSCFPLKNARPPEREPQKNPFRNRTTDQQNQAAKNRQIVTQKPTNSHTEK